MKNSARLALAGFAFLLYFLVVIGINFLPELYASIATPVDQATKARLAHFAKNELTKNGLAAILSIVVTFVTNVLTDDKDARPIDDEDGAPEPSAKSGGIHPQKSRKEYTQQVLEKFRSLRSDNAATRRELKKTARSLFRVRDLATRKYRLATVLYVALAFAMSHIPAQGIQAWVRLNLSLDKPEPVRFLVYFAQSNCLAVFAFIIGFYFHRRLMKVIRRSELKNVLLVGGGGIFCAGCIHLLQQGPEALTLLAQNVGRLDYVGVTGLGYVFLSKLVIFPLFGLAGAAAAGMLKLPVRKSK